MFVVRFDPLLRQIKLRSTAVLVFATRLAWLGLAAVGKYICTNDNAVMQSVASKSTELEMRAVSVYVGALQ